MNRPPLLSFRAQAILATLLSCAFFLAKGTSVLLAAELFPAAPSVTTPIAHMLPPPHAAGAIAETILDSGLFWIDERTTPEASIERAAPASCAGLRLVGSALPARGDGALALVERNGARLLLGSTDAPQQLQVSALEARRARVVLDDGTPCELAMVAP